jgi:hypothetical protein
MTDLELREHLATLQEVLATSGLHGALGHLNRRTPYRFTGLYRYDGDMLRSMALFDRWSPDIDEGEDAPMGETFCAIVRDTGEWLEVKDGRSDPRFPWMRENAVVCYSGALIRDADGKPFGTLCHFDVQRCQPSRSEVALLRAAGPLLHRFMAGAQPKASSVFPPASTGFA